MIGGEGGDKLKENMGQMIKLADSVEKKDANKALETASKTFIDPKLAKELKDAIVEKAGQEQVKQAEALI